MTDAQDTLENLLQHAHDLVDTFLSAEMHERITWRLADGLNYTLRDLLEQAQAALEEVCHERKPDELFMDEEKAQDTVTFDTAGIAVTVNFRKESLLVVQEMVKYIDHASCVGQGLLDAVERQDKPTANEKPGEAS